MLFNKRRCVRVRLRFFFYNKSPKLTILTRFNKIAIQATARMAANKEAVGLSFTVIWGKYYSLTPNLLCPFTNVRSCPPVRLPVIIGGIRYLSCIKRMVRVDLAVAIDISTHWMNNATMVKTAISQCDYDDNTSHVNEFSFN